MHITTKLKLVKKSFLVLMISFITIGQGAAQCFGTGNETDYGAGSWIGYIYEGANNYTTNYRGRVSATENFDTDFCGGPACTITTNTCTLTAENFSARFRMTQTYAEGIYGITIGGDDGVRLSIDGGATYVLQDFGYHAYQTVYTEVRLSGTYNLVFDYFEGGGDNRASIQITYIGTETGGQIGSNQDICVSGTGDPDAFTSNIAALYASGATPNYQWEVSPDGGSWSDVAGATAETYDIPAGYTGLNYYRRSAESGGVTVYSNTLTVQLTSRSGDDTAVGSGSWIGHVYDGVNNFGNNYKGDIYESEIFDESFGGDNVTSSTSGCDYQTETFTVRFEMLQTFEHGLYDFQIGGDDGVRLSVDGGSTWVIDDYSNHGYRTADAFNVEMNGSHHLVLDYYEAGGGNRVTFSYTQQTLLPVTYLFLKAENEGFSNVIRWATATEIDNDFFEVQKTADGESWEVIGEVSGHGTCKEVTNYEFTDSNVSPGVSVYYRLKQVDFDGQEEYSSLVRVGLAYTEMSSLSIYPNPAVDQVNIHWPGFILKEVKIFNLAGVLVRSSNEMQIGLDGLEPGYYLIRVTDPEHKETSGRLIIRQ